MRQTVVSPRNYFNETSYSSLFGTPIDVFESAVYEFRSTMTDHSVSRHRELGVEFGVLGSQIEEHSYPTTKEELADEYGDHVIEFSNGTESVRDILDPFTNETYESPIEVQHAMFNMVDSRAIGRKNYSDRTPPAPGERREDMQLSF